MMFDYDASPLDSDNSVAQDLSSNEHLTFPIIFVTLKNTTNTERKEAFSYELIHPCRYRAGQRCSYQNIITILQDIQNSLPCYRRRIASSCAH